MPVSKRTLSLALALSPGVGGRTVSRVLARMDLLGIAPEEFLAVGADALCEEFRLTRKAAMEWSCSVQERMERAQEVQLRLERRGVSWHTMGDAGFPSAIEEMDPDGPGVVFVYGNKSLLQADTFCVLASRKAPPDSLDEVERLTEDGVLRSKTLVSGHDTPEYRRSAIVPLRWGAPRILVLDTGLFAALGEELDEEPFRTARLWRYKFDPITDLCISPVNPEVEYQPNANRIRDRVITSLSREINVVWMSPGGNMERVAMMGLRAGRTVRLSPICPNAEDFRSHGAEVLSLSSRLSASYAIVTAESRYTS